GFGGDINHPVLSSAAIQRGSCSTFEHGDVGNIVGIDQLGRIAPVKTTPTGSLSTGGSDRIEVHIGEGHTVYYKKSVVVTTNGRLTPDRHFGRSAHGSTIASYLQARHFPLKCIQVIDLLGFLNIGTGQLLHGIAQISCFSLNSECCDHDLFE